jgi:hypothetical protein
MMMRASRTHGAYAPPCKIHAVYVWTPLYIYGASRYIVAYLTGRGCLYRHVRLPFLPPTIPIVAYQRRTTATRSRLPVDETEAPPPSGQAVRGGGTHDRAGDCELLVWGDAAGGELVLLWDGVVYLHSPPTATDTESDTVHSGDSHSAAGQWRLVLARHPVLSMAMGSGWLLLEKSSGEVSGIRLSSSPSAAQQGAAGASAGERWLWERYVAQLSAGLTGVKEGGTLEMMTDR